MLLYNYIQLMVSSLYYVQLCYYITTSSWWWGSLPLIYTI
jgi:hypothetical protein